VRSDLLAHRPEDEAGKAVAAPVADHSDRAVPRSGDQRRPRAASKASPLTVTLGATDETSSMARRTTDSAISCASVTNGALIGPGAP
jgi:hypothetical protein